MSAIAGQILNVTVVAGKKLRDTEMFTEQDPYVCLEYGSSRLRTRTSADGGRNPTFEEKFQIPLIDGLRELNITVWNSNTLTQDDFIGSGRDAGEVKLILHCSGLSKKKNSSVGTSYAPPAASPYGPPQPYAQPPPPMYTPVGGYPYTGPPTVPPAYAPPLLTNQYQPTAYPPAPYPSYAQSYPPPPVVQSPCYPPPGTYPGAYPPSY